MKVSIALALHNGAAHLDEQLRSILQGSRLPDEWVLVDDASTDGSPDIAMSLLADYRIEQAELLTNEENIGATLSFVKAVGHTTGDVVLFCDQDDIWHSDKISAICNLFKENPALLLAYHDGDIIDAHGVPDERTIWGTRKHAKLSAGDQRERMDVAANPDIKGCTMALNGEFVRKLFIETPASFAEYWGHDHWCALMAWGSGPVTAMPQRLIKHRLHDRNTSGGTSFNALLPSHWRKRLQLMREQAPDHFVQRYALAATALRNHAPMHDTGMAAALDRHLEIARRRMEFKRRNQFRRMIGAFQLWHEGYYQRYANGGWTLLRDILA
jgi:glycosyltransferase involved in cell wall biosynthesis